MRYVMLAILFAAVALAAGCATWSCIGNTGLMGAGWRQE